MTIYSNSPIDPYELFIQKELNAIVPNIYDNIEMIVEQQYDIGLKILTILVEFACLGQNVTPIILARKKIGKIPSDWLVQHLPVVIPSTINMDDEWEYRRLLELLSLVAPQLLKRYVRQGLASNNEEVREAAADFSK